MSKGFRGSMVVLAAVMALVGVLALGAAQPVQAVALDCAVPLVCDATAINNYCSCLDGDMAACTAAKTAELCGTDEAGVCGDDSRVNTNCSAPEILYCNGDDAEFYQYNYSTGKGLYHFSIPLADLMQPVEVRTLLKQVGKVKVYLNPDGTVELQAPQTDGKIYFMVFDPGQCASLQEGAEWGLK
jgi:hypothetical protein